MAIEKEVKWTLAADDEATPKVVKLGKTMQKELVEVSKQTVKNFIKVNQASKKMQAGLSETEKKVTMLASSNENLASSMGDVSKMSQGFLEGVGHQIAGITKNAILLTGAFVGVKAITKFFPVLEESIFRVSEASLKASFAADRAFSEFAQGGKVLKAAKDGFFQLASKGLHQTSVGLTVLKKNLTSIRSGLEATTLFTKAASKATLGTGKAFVAAAKHTELFEKGMAGAITRAGVGATAFGALGTSLLASDGIMKKMAGVTLIALGLALGGLVIFANQALHAIGNLAIAVGDKLTKASEKQIQTFSEAEKTTFAFNHTIAAYSKTTEEAAKNTKSWTKFQQDLSASSGTTAATMRALIAETISATESMHLSEQQQQKLIESTLDLSERAHKPAIDTLTAMINAMNGAGQGVVALGLHMNDSAIQHSKLSAKQKEVFKTADDAAKGQMRFAVLMEQAGKAAGFATQNADLYSKAVKLQKNAQETLNAELGRGAAIVNGEYRLGLATATNAMTQFFKPMLPGIGFLQALGGRVLQVGGFLTKHALTIALVTSSYKALNTLLARGFAGGVFGKEIPFINKSLGRMAKDLGATNIQLSSLKNVGKASFQILTTQAGNGVKTLIGLDASAKLTAKTMSGQMVKGLQAVGKGIVGVTRKAMMFIATPVGATIAAVVAGVYLLYQAFKVLEKETGIFTQMWSELSEAFAGTTEVLNPLFDVLKQIGVVLVRVIGVSVKVTSAALAQMVRGVFEVVLAFQKLSQFLPESMRASAESIANTEAKINKLNEASKKLALGALSDLGNLFMDSAVAAEMSTTKMAAWVKELQHVESVVSKFGEKAKKSFEFASEFTPNINLNKFKKDAQAFEATLIDFQGALEDKKMTLMDAPQQTAEIKKALSETIQQIADAEEAIQGIRIKKAQEIRNTRVQIVNMELQQQRDRVWTVEQEIKEMRLGAARDTRDQLVQIETQRLLTQRDLMSAESQAGITIKQEALLEANAMELSIFKSKLDAERALALTAEQQKQSEVASMRASILSGTSGGAGAGEDVAALQEKEKFATLKLLRDQDLISETQYQNDKMAVVQAGKQRQFELEMQMEMEKANMLGTSPEGLQAKLDLQVQRDALELENLTMKLQQKHLTEEQFSIAKEELVLASEERMSKVKENHLTKELARAQKHGSFMDRLRIRTEMNTIQGAGKVAQAKAFFQSSEVKTAQSALGNLSTLMQSSNKKMFEVGKAASIASAVVNTAVGFTRALAEGGPIMGPILGATVIAAGAVQIANIKSQKFSGGGSSAGSSGAAPAAPAPSATLGGQAHKGMDAVPQSMNNKSFIVAGGERIVQPEANKDLTNFLANGGGEKGNTYNISIQAGPGSDVEGIKQAVMDGIREASERGEPVINAKGVVNG